MDWFLSLPTPLQGFLAGLIAWIPASVGAAMVFPFRNLSPKLMNGMLGLAGGIMLAASFYSLLNPAHSHAEAMGLNPLIPVMCGFIAGVLFLLFAGSSSGAICDTDKRRFKFSHLIHGCDHFIESLIRLWRKYFKGYMYPVLSQSVYNLHAVCFSPIRRSGFCTGSHNSLQNSSMRNPGSWLSLRFYSSPSFYHSRSVLHIGSY